jgi:hypothetical protein
MFKIFLALSYFLLVSRMKSTFFVWILDWIKWMTGYLTESNSKNPFKLDLVENLVLDLIWLGIQSHIQSKKQLTSYPTLILIDLQWWTLNDFLTI